MVEESNKKVIITEIGPRDGFQSIKDYITPEIKCEVIDATIAAGVKRIQCTSFVSPKAIPQMRDAAQVAQYVIEKYPGMEVTALVPNFRGAQNAVSAGIKEVATVISLSKSHNKANVNRTHEESFDELKRILDAFPELKIDLDVATAFGCPFEGRAQVDQLVEFVGKLWDIGIRCFNICDTIGVAYPSQVRESFAALMKAFPQARYSAHIHDTRNMGIVNSLEAVRSGVKMIQTTLGGLGGCPFAPGASGNTATEDFNYMLLCEGYETGIDHQKLLAAARLLKSKVDGNYSGHHINITTDQCGFSEI